MLTIDTILKISTPLEFEQAALEIFRFQARHCPPYRQYLEAAGIEPASVKKAAEIPFLPIELFKTHRVYCGGAEPETVFTSSSTGGGANAHGGFDDKRNYTPQPSGTTPPPSQNITVGGGESRHYVALVADYEKSYTHAFELFYGPVADWSVYALLPSYLEREGSSLVRMADGLITRGRAGGFYLYDHDKLMRDMTADGGKKILLGVSYALLDLAERDEKLPAGTVVMETGGMKGRREEMPKEKMHEILRQAFGLREIHSEYGMAELMSQAYSAGRGVFRTPPWMRVSVRDLSDPFDVSKAGRGGINIIDLANLSSCAFIQTQDLGTVAPDGSFTIDGRIARADVRGCNLLVQ